MNQRDQERLQKCSRCNQWDNVYFLHDWDDQKLCDDCYDAAFDAEQEKDRTYNENRA